MTKLPEYVSNINVGWRQIVIGKKCSLWSLFYRFVFDLTNLAVETQCAQSRFPRRNAAATWESPRVPLGTTAGRWAARTSWDRPADTPVSASSPTASHVPRSNRRDLRWVEQPILYNNKRQHTSSQHMIKELTTHFIYKLNKQSKQSQVTSSRCMKFMFYPYFGGNKLFFIDNSIVTFGNVEPAAFLVELTEAGVQRLVHFDLGAGRQRQQQARRFTYRPHQHQPLLKTDQSIHYVM